jgi:hypothetical protein
MFKKLMNGFVFGVGFAIAFILVVEAYFQFFLQAKFENNFANSEVLDTPPTIKEVKRFLGSPAIYSGGFLDNKSGVLSNGHGEIVGKAILNNAPLSNLKLRLALNGSIMSQWAITDSDGTYSVSVPYGEYKIDGFELDLKSANSILAGKINHPQNAHSSDKFEVSKENKGLGLKFRFIDPIEKNISKNIYSTSEEIILKWEPYPAATQYSIQIFEKTDPHAFIGNKTLFDWSSKPIISDTSFNLKQHSIKLKAGHFYVVEIIARDDNMDIVSQTHRMHSGYDFEITN